MQVKRVHVLAGLLVVLAAYLLWCRYGGPAKISSTHYQAAAIPKELAGEPKKTITTKAQVYADKGRAMRRLGMSEDDSTDDEDLETAAEVPPTPAGAKVVVFLNHSTGKTRTVVKANPIPLFSFEKGTEIGVRAGITSGGGQVGAIFVRRDLARIGAAYVAGYGEVTAGRSGGSLSRPEGKAMIEVSGRFNRFPGLE